MSIQFTLLARDHWEFFKFAMWNVPSVRSAVARSLLVLFLISFTIPAFFSFLSGIPNLFLLVVMPLILLIINVSFYLLRRHQMVTTRAHQTPGAIGEHTVVLTSDGIRETNSISDRFTSWSGITQITENSSHIFIFFQEGEAYLIPKRAFSEQEFAQSFLNQATSYWQQARR